MSCKSLEQPNPKCYLLRFHFPHLHERFDSFNSLTMALEIWASSPIFFFCSKKCLSAWLIWCAAGQMCTFCRFWHYWQSYRLIMIRLWLLWLTYVEQLGKDWIESNDNLNLPSVLGKHCMHSFFIVTMRKLNQFFSVYPLKRQWKKSNDS